MVRLGSLLIVFSLVLAGCGGSASTSSGPAAGAPTVAAVEQVQLGVGYIPSVQFAPFYVGMAKGFYAAEGIDLELAHGFENDYLKLVGVNELPFMIGSGDQVILGRAQGLPVRYVMNWYAKYPVIIFAKPEKNITAPADLKGKKVGLPGPYGANYVALRGVLEAAGLSEQDIQMESIGFTQAAAVSTDKVDAAVDYAVNGPVVLALEGISTTQITLDGYLPMPANGLVTNEATLREQPDLVRRMVRATRQAIAYTLANPDEAFQLALEQVPEAGGENEAANRAIFDASLAYWAPAPGQTPGATSAAAWQAAAEFMVRSGLVDKTTPVAELFSNEYLP